jgi:hypothetical protein
MTYQEVFNVSYEKGERRFNMEWWPCSILFYIGFKWRLAIAGKKIEAEPPDR